MNPTTSHRLEIVLVLAAGALAAAICVAWSVRAPALADEFVYLAGARLFADAASLASTYYFTDTILAVGHPHQDAHSPGYVMILGAVSRLLGPGYWSAVALNLVSLLAALWLLWSLASGFGRPRPVRLFTMAAATMPALLPYSSWVMPEWPVMALSLATLWIAVRWANRASGAIACGLVLGILVLVRESGIFLIPAAIALVGASFLRQSLFLGSFLSFCLAVFAPLNAGRPPVVTTTVSGSAGNSSAFRAVLDGEGGRAATLLVQRAERNLKALSEAGYEQQITLSLLLALPALSWLSWREISERARIALVGLTLGALGMVAATVTLSDIAGWNGPRYWTILSVAFYALLPSPVDRMRQSVLLAIAVLSAFTALSVLETFRRFKSHGSTVDEVAYFDRYAPPGTYKRVVWQNGYQLGLERYPAEVIVQIPATRRDYRALGRAVWFDYVVLSNWQTVLDEDPRFTRANADDPAPLLKIFRRLRTADPSTPRGGER